MRKTLVVLLAASAVLVPAASAQAAEPILFVHGWSSSGSVWNTMISRFQADGFSNLNNWSYNTAQSNRTTASQIATKVSQIRAATGAAKVDIITHSMGGLSSRWYVKFLGGTGSVDEWVSLGGPNHGTNLASLCFWQTSCIEMRAVSSFLSELTAATRRRAASATAPGGRRATKSSTRIRASPSPARPTRKRHASRTPP